MYVTLVSVPLVSQQWPTWGLNAHQPTPRPEGFRLGGLPNPAEGFKHLTRRMFVKELLGLSSGDQQPTVTAVEFKGIKHLFVPRTRNDATDNVVTVVVSGGVVATRRAADALCRMLEAIPRRRGGERTGPQVLERVRRRLPTPGPPSRGRGCVTIKLRWRPTGWRLRGWRT